MGGGSGGRGAGRLFREPSILTHARYAVAAPSADPEATKKAIDSDGFFDTGDLGKINPLTGDLILTGRCKDTIVLSNGENIEPSPIEDKILSSSGIIEQVMLMGDDGRRLVAVAVVDLGGLEEKVRSSPGGA